MSPNSKGILYMYAHLIIVLSVSKAVSTCFLITHVHSVLVSFAIDISKEVLHQCD